MHELIGEVHPGIAAAFGYMNYDDVDLGRLDAERRSEDKRKTLRRNV
jgi:hypothetical protein